MNIFKKLSEIFRNHKPSPDRVQLPDNIKLVERAIRNAKPYKVERVPRWYAVSYVFALGSTYSIELCKRFNIDPHEFVETRCEACENRREEDEENDYE